MAVQGSGSGLGGRHARGGATRPRGASSAGVLVLLLPLLLALSQLPRPSLAEAAPGLLASGLESRWAPLRRALPQVLLVELTSAPTATGGREESIRSEREAFLAELDQAGIGYHVRGTFEGLFNGLSLRVDDPARADEAADIISRLAHVTGVSRGRRVKRPTLKKSQLLSPHTLQRLETLEQQQQQQQQQQQVTPLDKVANDMGNVTQVHERLGITGQGIRIGIIDTGVDYTHPAFGACKSIGGDCRVAYGYDFVGDDYSPSTRPVPDPDPMDCFGHGTHVAGIAAGNSPRVVGVAPGATLGAYRVFGCNGDSSDDVILMAMERALQDGMDVINLSLGGGSAWPQDVEARLVDRLSRKGVVVCGAMGNSQEQGLWQAEAPSNARQAVAVASFDVDEFLTQAFLVSPDNTTVQYGQDPSMDAPFKDGLLALSSNETNVAGDGCSPYEGKEMEGKVVLIRRGLCYFKKKAQHAEAAGAVGVIFYNNDDEGTFTPKADESIKIPTVGISKKEGVFLVKRALKEAVRVHWTKDGVRVKNPTGGEVSPFSSWGLSPDLAFKPDIGAPGSDIFSSYPMKLGGYAVVSGTSMATPYVAGASALLIEAARKAGRKRLSPRQLRRVLQNNAVPMRFKRHPKVLFPVPLQGSGMVNALRAINSRTRAMPATLKLGYSKRGRTVRKLVAVRNGGNRTMEYTLVHAPAATVNGTDTVFPTMTVSRPSKVTFLPKRLTLGPGATKPVLVSITPHRDIPLGQQWVYSGYIKVQPEVPTSQPDPQYSSIFVPYVGMKGDYLAYQVLPTGDFGPGITSNGSLMSFFPPQIEQNAKKVVTFTFDKATQDWPVFLGQILHPAPLITFRLYKARSNRPVGYVDYRTFVGQTTSFPMMPWDYLTSNWASPEGKPAVRKHPRTRPNHWTAVRDGRYYVKVTVKKALGPNALVQEKETWRSPTMIFKTKKH